MNPVQADKHVVVWNSHYRSVLGTPTTDCSVNYAHHHRLGDAMGLNIRSITFNNLFPNVYGLQRDLHITVNGVDYTITIPEGHYKSYAELDTAVLAAINTVVADLGNTVVTDVDTGIMTITIVPVMPATPVVFKSQATLRAEGILHSLNQMIGVGTTTDTTAAGSGASVSLESPVNLSGPRIVRIGSSLLGSGHTVHPNGDTGDYIGSVSLAGYNYGDVVHYQWEDHTNTNIVFRNSRDCSTLDFHLHDEYGEFITLPGNANVDIELVVTSHIS